MILPFFNMQEITVRGSGRSHRRTQVSRSSEPGTAGQDPGVPEYGEWLSVNQDGPLWFRGYDQWSEAEGAAQIDRVLDAYKVAHIVVGHTVQRSGRIRPRFGNKVFLIDTGMLSSYYPGGRASALEICGDAKFTAKYMDQEVVLIDPTASPGKASSAAAAGVEMPTRVSEKPDLLPAVGGICPATAPLPR